jgi:TonB family protein
VTLIPCPECRRAVSSAAFQCPGCGQPLGGGDARPPRRRDRILPLVLGGALLASVLGSAGIWMVSARFHDGDDREHVEIIRTIEVTHEVHPAPPIPGRLGALPEIQNGAEVSRMIARLYPPLLRDAGVPGMAVVHFRVTGDGRPDLSSVEVRHATHDAFGAAAPRVVERMRFRPGRVDGRPADTWLTVPIVFDPTR